MLSPLDPYAQQFLNNLGQITDAMNRAQEQVTTGSRINRVSDAPDSISSLLQARADLSSTQQTLTNLSRVQTQVNTGESVLESAVQMFNQVQTLGAEGATSTQTASSRADLAQQVNSILQQLVSAASTTVEGRYIFSGDSDQVAPYTYNASNNPPVSAYQGSAATTLAMDPNGTTFPVSLTAQQIFDSSDPTANVFTSIENLSSALSSNSDSAIQNAISGLSHVSDYLNTQLAFYGTTQNRITSAINFGQNLQNQLQSQIGNLQDADMSQSITEMTQAQTQYQAALTSRAQMPRTTLFDFLG